MEYGHALCKRHNALTQDEDSKRSLCEAEMMQRRLPRNRQSLLQIQLLLLQPSLHPQLLSVEVPKVPISMRSRVLTMRSWTMMMMWKLMMQAVGLARTRSLPKTRNLETLKSILINSMTHQVIDPLNIKVVITPATRSPEADPEVNLEVNHLMGLAVVLP